MSNNRTAEGGGRWLGEVMERSAMRRKTVWCVLSWGAAMAFVCGVRGETDDLRRRASWSPPTPAQVRSELDAWLAARNPSPAVRRRVESLGAMDPRRLEGPQLLERLGRIAAEVDPEARRLVALCQHETAPAALPSFPFLDEQAEPSWMRNNLKLLFGRWLAQHALYDEAAAQLDGLAPGDVADPAALLFYQSVVWHWLLEKDRCLAAIDKLLENEAILPRRYAVTARLMKADLAPLQADSLDEVARLMRDIRRRLDFSRAGARVRKEEEDVVAKLDKMIEEMEKQQQQRQAKSAQSMKPQQPMQDSMPGGGKGPGRVDPKKIGARSGWGDLPPKERQQALQQISNDLPAHYREVIEEYFRKLARDAGG